MNQTRARAVVEVLVEVGRFTNVELFERGVYAVRARVKAPSPRAFGERARVAERIRRAAK